MIRAKSLKLNDIKALSCIYAEQNRKWKNGKHFIVFLSHQAKEVLLRNSVQKPILMRIRFDVRFAFFQSDFYFCARRTLYSQF